jgi:hypothetical protein
VGQNALSWLTLHLSYNGFGGKPLRDESMRDCALRELEVCQSLIQPMLTCSKEECTLVPSSSQSFRQAAQLVITRPTLHSGVETPASTVTLSVDVYVCNRWQGEPTECVDSLHSPCSVS